jgi:FkbM family methyltransferase
MKRNKLTEPWWLFWLKWHFYRRFKKGLRYRVVWNFRNFMRRAEPSVMIDCGANVGDVTGLFLRQGFTVHAFEPDPAARSVLETRFGQNSQLHIHAAAVGSAANRQRFYREAGIDRDISGTISSSLLPRDIHDDSQSIDVDVVDLFDFISTLRQRVDVLKLDIEGAEAPILEKMLDLRFDRQIGAIFVETHERFSPEIARSIDRTRQRIEEMRITNIDLTWR